VSHAGALLPAAGLKYDAPGAALVEETAQQLLPAIDFSITGRYRQVLKQGACSLGELRARVGQGRQADQSSLEAAQALVLKIDSLEGVADSLSVGLDDTDA
jgi:hypothetical protein